MDDQDFKKIFTTHKSDISDDGFSKRLIEQLPERKSILPQAVMIVCIMIGLILTFAMQGFTPLFEQINSLITSISHLQMPSLSSIFTYLGVLIMTGFIGYSIMRTE